MRRFYGLERLSQCGRPLVDDRPASEGRRAILRRAECVLIELKRARTFVLSGRATLSQMDRDRIVLTDVVPDETGWVRLSLHYQQELHVAPMNVTSPPTRATRSPF